MTGATALERDPAMADPDSIPLDRIDVSDARLYQRDAHRPFFARLRREDPVHYCPDSAFGPYWSVTRYQDILAVDKAHRIFSSAEGIVIGDAPKDFVTRNFISSDPPVHGPERRAAAPAVAPLQLDALEAVMRRNTAEVLDALPRGETFNWVEHVSIELTTRMLAVLFDFPFEERHLLPYWSDVATSSPRSGNMTVDQTKRQKIMMEYAGRFAEI